MMRLGDKLLFLLAILASLGAESPPPAAQPMRAALIPPDQATARQLRKLKSSNYTGIALYLRDDAEQEDNLAAARRVLESNLTLYYWIDIGRNQTLADAHPEWMASLQTHSEWRRHFPTFPAETETQVVKNYPWVPVGYKETFDAHLERVDLLLEELPRPAGIFLNHLQAAPSACGCGNAFCRWTADYGAKLTATPLGADAAARFVAEVKKLAPNASIIPVWTTECAEHDGGKDGACNGIPCFSAGRCWKEYSRQLGSVASESSRLGVLLPLRDFEAGSKSGSPGDWHAYALKSFWEIVPASGGPRISPERLISVVQGWEAGRGQIELQIARSRSAGVSNVVVALSKIDQSWRPRLLDLPK